MTRTTHAEFAANWSPARGADDHPVRDDRDRDRPPQN
jgi:hypothetical protein